jgi:hypothetical protein
MGARELSSRHWIAKLRRNVAGWPRAAAPLACQANLMPSGFLLWGALVLGVRNQHRAQAEIREFWRQWTNDCRVGARHANDGPFTALLDYAGTLGFPSRGTCGSLMPHRA